MSYIVYLLKNTQNNYTYLGITNNSEKRIRQHNGIIKGGARYTKLKKGNGIWIYHVQIPNLTKSEALSLERIAKNKRKRANGRTPLEKIVGVLISIIDDREIIYL